MSDSCVALMGGTFDPIHVGHLIVARSVREQLALDQVIFIPSAKPPHKQQAPISDVAHRLEMVKLAIDEQEGFACDDCETKRPGPSYTFDTVMDFRKRFGEQAAIHWIIGPDSLAELETWYRVKELVEACRIITVSRPGWDKPQPPQPPRLLSSAQVTKLEGGILQTPRVDISATDIRRRVATGKSIRYLVPDSVEQYIVDRQLYRNPKT